jgi:solute carrier family 25 aspartate/glutamate transporter 12/13
MQNMRAAPVGAAPLYDGPVDCFRKIVRLEGARGLYRGLRPNLIGVTPEKAIKLAINDVAREHFTERNGDGRIRLWQEMLSGALAGFFQVAATNPMEIVKLRMQLQGEAAAAAAGGGASATAPAARKSAAGIVAELGVRGLYKGVAACWLRDVPFSITFFPLFANLKVRTPSEKERMCVAFLF